VLSGGLEGEHRAASSTRVLGPLATLHLFIDRLSWLLRVKFRTKDLALSDLGFDQALFMALCLSFSNATWGRVAQLTLQDGC
jgi:hypothetical protein